MNLTENEINELKKDLLYFVKRLSQKGYNSPEEVRFLPAIVQTLLGWDSLISGFKFSEKKTGKFIESENFTKFDD